MISRNALPYAYQVLTVVVPVRLVILPLEYFVSLLSFRCIVDATGRKNHKETLKVKPISCFTCSRKLLVDVELIVVFVRIYNFYFEDRPNFFYLFLAVD